MELFGHEMMWDRNVGHNVYRGKTPTSFFLQYDVTNVLFENVWLLSPLSV